MERGIKSGSLIVRNPYNGEEVGKLPLADGQEVEKAVQAAVRGAELMRELSRFERARILHQITEQVQTHKEELTELIVKEGGKPWMYAQTEVDRSIFTLTLAAEEVRRFTGEVVPIDLGKKTEHYTAHTERFPLGLILGITPFNFPLNLALHKLAPALATGNSFILKPPPQTPLTALRLATLVKETDLPKEAFQVVPCENDLAEKMVIDPRVKMLSFTGSAKVGWHLKKLASDKKVTLELGGNAAVIVCDDANLETTVSKCALGAFIHAGQVCISVQRIYVDEKVYDSFVEKFVAIAKKVKCGPTRDPEVWVGPMIDSKSADRVLSWIEEAKQKGARVLLAGQRNGNVISPWVLSDVDPSAALACEEAFGPVAIVEKFKAFEEALKCVNQSPYGLQAGLFTSNVHRIYQAFRELEVGAVTVNETSAFRSDNMPYGGVKRSGFGREGLRYAMEEMTEARLLILNLN